MLKKHITLIIFISLFLVSSDVMTQGNPTPCPDGTAPPCGHVPPPNSIDGGLGILLALGIGYAVKKLRKEDL